MNLKQQLGKIKRSTTRTLLQLLPNYQINYDGNGEISMIDVGSIDGLPEPWFSHAHRIRFLLNFEPNEAIKKGQNYMTYNTALWESDETKPFFIYKGFSQTGSSLFKQNFEYVRANFSELKKRGSPKLADTWFDRSELIKTIELKCRSLDNILAEEFPDRPFHFMKIDAQGAEYNILKGSTAFLKNSCAGLHLELFTLPLYKGIALLDEVEEYLSGFGFQLVKKYPPHGTFHSQHDCLFIKESANGYVLDLIRSVYRL
jgi:FkbM family methyltransferase